jgi:hypothetical protein
LREASDLFKGLLEMNIDQAMCSGMQADLLMKMQQEADTGDTGLTWVPGRLPLLIISQQHDTYAITDGYEDIGWTYTLVCLQHMSSTCIYWEAQAAASLAGSSPASPLPASSSPAAAAAAVVTYLCDSR